MCVPGCQETIARRLSRRGLFGSAALAAGLTATAVAARAATPVRFERVVDLTHTLSEAFPTYGGAPGIALRRLNDIARDGYNQFEWTITEHTGTHMDAPLHFSRDGASADLLPVEQLVLPLVVIDVTEAAKADPDHRLGAADLAAHEGRHGPVPAGACLALRSGWDGHVGTAMFRNADAAGVMRFPGFHPEVVKLLLDRGMAAVAVDTLSLDNGSSKDFAFHYAWLGAGRFGLECVANLHQVPATGATLVVGGPKIKGVTGGPTRLLALV